MLKVSGCSKVVAGIVAAWFSAFPVFAQKWTPSRPVAMIVGSGAGGGIDQTARLLQKEWERGDHVKTPIVVVNKPGAGGSVAWTYLNERSGDGHAVSLGTVNLVSNPVMGKSLLGYKDVTPLALLIDDYFILMVRADSPLKTLEDVKQRLARDPAALSIGFGPGLGSGSHVAAAMVAKELGANVSKGRYIPYRNANDAVAGMLGGEIDIVSGTAVTSPGFLASGRVRGLAVIAPQRLGGALAQVPTVHEQGVKSAFINWRGVIGPKGMSKDQVAYWVKALGDVSRTENWQKELEKRFWRANFKSGPELDRFLVEQSSLFNAIWKDMGMTGAPR